MDVKQKKLSIVDYIYISIIIFLILILYIQTIGFGFTNWDDPTYIVKNNYLQHFNSNNLINLFIPGKIPREKLFIPITYFSYMFEIFIYGCKPAIFHLVNVLLHIINSILLYFFVLFVFKKREVAFIASLIFAMHPLQSEAVCWIMGRKDLLMTMFSLLSLVYWVKDSRIEKNTYFIISFVCLLLACLSKPSAVVLPLLMVLVSIYFKKEESLNIDKLRLLPFFLCAAFIIFINLAIPIINETELLFNKNMFYYIPSLIFGWLNRIFLIESPHIIYSINKGSPIFTIDFNSLLMVMVLFALIVYLAKNRVKGTLLCIIFTIISFGPAFNEFVTTRVVFTADRYGYFPLIGLYILIGLIIEYEDKFPAKKVKYLLVSVWILFMIYSTYQIIPAWKSTKSLWEYELKVDPGSPVGLHNLANYYFDTGNKKLAVELLIKAVKEKPIAESYFYIGELYRGEKNYKKAGFYYKKAVEFDPKNSEYHGLLGTMYLKEGKLEKAEKELLEVIKIDPNIPKSYLFLSEIYARKKDFKKSEAIYRIYEEKSMYKYTNN